VIDPLPRTEQRNPVSSRLGELSAANVVALMNKEEYQVLTAVEQAAPLLARAAEQVAGVFGAGGRTVFIGSGTSGRIALQEAAELPPTFGVPPDSFMVMAVGGALTGPAALTWNEDDVQAAPDALSRSRIGQGDAVIGLAASGTTPFVRAGLRAAGQAGAWTCGIANNPDVATLYDRLGMLYRDKFQDHCKAAEVLKEGAKIHNAPVYMHRFAAYELAQCPGHEREAYDLLLSYYKIGEQERLPTLMKWLGILQEKLNVPADQKIYIPPAASHP